MPRMMLTQQASRRTFLLLGVKQDVEAGDQRAYSSNDMDIGTTGPGRPAVAESSHRLFYHERNHGTPLGCPGRGIFIEAWHRFRSHFYTRTIHRYCVS